MKTSNKVCTSVIFYMAMIILNLTIFTDLLPFNTLLKGIVILLLTIKLITERRNKIKINSYIYAMILFAIFVVINLLFGGDISYITTFCLNILIMVLLMQFPEYSNVEVKLASTMCFIQLLFSIYAEVMPISIVNNTFRKIILYDYNVNYSWRNIMGVNVGITKQPGTCAMYMVTLSSFFFAKIAKEKISIKYIIGYVLTIAVIFMTSKRSAIIFSIGTAIIMCLLFSRKRITYKSIFKIIVITILVAGLAYLINLKFDFLEGVKNKNDSLSISNDISNGREEIWKNSINLFFEKPLFGIGLKKYYGLKGVDIHNTYLQYLVEMGIIGFCAFTLCFGYLINSCIWKCKKVYIKGLKDMKVSTIMGLYLLIFLILYGFVGNTFIDYFPLSLFIISVSMIVNDLYLKEVKK